jgi:mono/diheme cytochrome c family protein
LIRTVFERPGNDMPVYTKIATVFSEDLRKHSQFDGSIANLHARSSLAALAAGATVENMSLPEIADNIRKASDYTSTLRPPRYAELFPQQPAADAARLARGSEVYRQHCYGCHGGRDPVTGSWQNGPKVGEVAPLGIIKTDPERVMFRHYGDMGDRLHRVFPEKQHSRSRATRSRRGRARRRTSPFAATSMRRWTACSCARPICTMPACSRSPN